MVSLWQLVFSQALLGFPLTAAAGAGIATGLTLFLAFLRSRVTSLRGGGTVLAFVVVLVDTG